MQIKVQGTTIHVNTKSDAVVRAYNDGEATYRLMRTKAGLYWLWGRIRIFNSGFVPGLPIFNLDTKGRLTNVAWAMSQSDADEFIKEPAAAIDALDMRTNDEELRHARRWALAASSRQFA